MPFVSEVQVWLVSVQRHEYAGHHYPTHDCKECERLYAELERLMGGAESLEVVRRPKPYSNADLERMVVEGEVARLKETLR